VRWGDAITEAGLEPNTLSPRKSDDAILRSVADACLTLKKFPTQNDLRVYWRSSPQVASITTIRAHFPRWSILANVLREWVLRPTNHKYAEIADMLPATAKRQPSRLIIRNMAMCIC